MRGDREVSADVVPLEAIKVKSWVIDISRISESLSG
jgi:hypothetical protein